MCSRRCNRSRWRSRPRRPWRRLGAAVAPRSMPVRAVMMRCSTGCMRRGLKAPIWCHGALRSMGQMAGTAAESLLVFVLRQRLQLQLVERHHPR